MESVGQHIPRDLDFDACVDAFMLAVDVKDSTRKTYRKALDVFGTWMKAESIDFQSVTRNDIIAFKDSLLGTNHSALTVNLYLSALRQFFKWAEGEGRCANVAASVGSVRTNKNTFRKMHLDSDEGAQLLDKAAVVKEVHGVNDGVTRVLSASEYEIAMRNYAMINLMLRTGLRTIEVSRADVGDIVRKKGKRILKVWGKGHSEKDDFVVLTDMAYEPIRQYLTLRPGAAAAEPLFTTVGLNNSGKRMSTRTIQHICKETLRSIGLDGHEFSAHSIRHTTATQILLKGGTMLDVQQVLRHATPVTSQLYVNTIMEDKRLDDASEKLLDSSFLAKEGEK